MDRPRSMAAGPRGHTGQTAVVPVGVGSLPGRGSAINHCEYQFKKIGKLNKVQHYLYNKCTCVCNKCTCV